MNFDPEFGTVVWPNGFNLDPDVLYGDHEPAAKPITDRQRHVANAA